MLGMIWCWTWRSILLLIHVPTQNLVSLWDLLRVLWREVELQSYWWIVVLCTYLHPQSWKSHSFDWWLFVQNFPFSWLLTERDLGASSYRNTWLGWSCYWLGNIEQWVLGIFWTHLGIVLPLHCNQLQPPWRYRNTFLLARSILFCASHCLDSFSGRRWSKPRYDVGTWIVLLDRFHRYRFPLQRIWVVWVVVVVVVNHSHRNWIRNDYYLLHHHLDDWWRIVKIHHQSWLLVTLLHQHFVLIPPRREGHRSSSCRYLWGPHRRSQFGWTYLMLSFRCPYSCRGGTWWTTSWKPSWFVVHWHPDWLPMFCSNPLRREQPQPRAILGMFLVT